MNHLTQPLSSADISIFKRKSVNFAISRNTDIDCILIYNFYFLKFFESLNSESDCFNKKGYDFDDVNKNGYFRPY